MKTTAVIPAYNEEQTIGIIANKLVSHRLVNNVVVVSDGSADNTAEVARTAGAWVIENEDNLGKGAAMQVGINSQSAAESDIILFLDADLLGLTADHVDKLLTPLINKEAEMTLGIFTDGRVQTDLGHKITPFLSGQRAVKQEILENISNLAVTRFGVEMAVTKYVKENNIAVKKVKLKDLTHRMKEEKMGFWKGLGERIKMYWEVIKSLPDEDSKLK